MGAERARSAGGAVGTNTDPGAYATEGPVHEVSLAPFFLAKFEMTQAQWKAATGRNPSSYNATSPFVASDHPWRHPVETVNWYEASATTRHLGMELPTESQLEYATRAGTQTVWWTGDDRESLRGAANLADQSAMRAEFSWPDATDWPGLDDGYPLHSPVGSFRANPFGLHDVHGNVWEWCRDRFADYTSPVMGTDAERSAANTQDRVTRNGDFMSRAAYARSAFRDRVRPDYKYFNLGLRPARQLDHTESGPDRLE
jgi:formylglycine-generating enzyme required for sulfatase activity